MEVILEYGKKKVNKKLRELSEKYWERKGYNHAYYVADLKNEFQIPSSETIPKYINKRCVAIIKGFENCKNCNQRFTFDNRDILYGLKHIGGLKCSNCQTHNEFPRRLVNVFDSLDSWNKGEEDDNWPDFDFIPKNNLEEIKDWPESPASDEQLTLMIEAYETDKHRHLTTPQHNFLLGYCRTISFELAAKQNGIGKDHKLKLLEFLFQERLVCEKTGFVLPSLRSLLLSDGEDMRAKNVFGFNDLKESLYVFLCNSKLHVFPGYPISRLFEMSQAEKFFTSSWSRQQFLACQVGYLVTSKSYNPLFVVDYLNKNKLEDAIEMNKQKAKKDFFLNLGLPHHEVIFEDLNDFEELRTRLGLDRS